VIAVPAARCVQGARSALDLSEQEPCLGCYRGGELVVAAEVPDSFDNEGAVADDADASSNEASNIKKVPEGLTRYAE
jgi:hypothetical protein